MREFVLPLTRAFRQFRLELEVIEATVHILFIYRAFQKFRLELEVIEATVHILF